MRTGASARAAFAAAPSAEPIQVPPMPPDRPGLPAALPIDPPPGRAGLRDDLLALAADAADTGPGSYPYLKSDDDWEPVGPPQPDPARAAKQL